MLEQLLLEDNALTALPDSIGNLTNLKELRINTNNISYYPDSLVNLTALKFLTWRGRAYRIPLFLYER